MEIDLKKVEACDIIIKKNVDITLLRRCKNVDSYNKLSYQKIEESEFALIKELMEKY